MTHQTVLLHEAVDSLNIKPDGVYVDATFGRGGHTALILSHLGSQGKLVVCDQDETAIQTAREKWGQDPRLITIHDNFGHLDQHLQSLGLWGKIDGILFDLGVSSPQLDEAERGFSFLKAGPLDMRMDQTRGLPLSEKLKTVTPQELIRILREYGEERFAVKIANVILTPRSGRQNPEQPKLGPDASHRLYQDDELYTTRDLAKLIEKTIPKKFQDPHKHPATRTFQALRIWVNEELAALERALSFFPEMLAVGGRAVFISFHSLEDRPVKERMRSLTSPLPHPRGLPIRSNDEDSPPMRICIKMHKPSDEEVKHNPRSRSAVLRVMERIR